MVLPLGLRARPPAAGAPAAQTMQAVTGPGGRHAPQPERLSASPSAITAASLSAVTCPLTPRDSRDHLPHPRHGGGGDRGAAAFARSRSAVLRRSRDASRRAASPRALGRCPVARLDLSRLDLGEARHAPSHRAVARVVPKGRGQGRRRHSRPGAELGPEGRPDRRARGGATQAGPGAGREVDPPDRPSPGAEGSGTTAGLRGGFQHAPRLARDREGLFPLPVGREPGALPGA